MLVDILSMHLVTCFTAFSEHVLNILVTFLTGIETIFFIIKYSLVVLLTCLGKY
jgi:hypothetical protein